MGPFHVEPGDYIAWHFGPTQFRGHVQKILRGGEEIVVILTTGVRWNLFPDYDSIDRLGPTRAVEIREVER